MTTLIILLIWFLGAVATYFIFNWSKDNEWYEKAIMSMAWPLLPVLWIIYKIHNS